MSYVALISDQYLKDNSVLADNIDPKLTRPTVRMCQEKYILPLLGTALYNNVMGAVSGAPTVTLTGTYATLLHDYVQPCLMWYTISESTLPISYRMTNKNIVRKTSQNSTPAELNEILHIKDDAKNNAEWYAERLHKYLVANTATFPEYDNAGTAWDTIYPRRFVFSDKISLGRHQTKSSLNTTGGDIEVGKKDCDQ